MCDHRGARVGIAELGGHEHGAATFAGEFGITQAAVWGLAALLWQLVWRDLDALGWWDA